MNHQFSLLVSLCNLAEVGETGVLRMDTGTGALTPVKLGATRPIKSCTGMTCDDTRIYVLCQDLDYQCYLAGLKRDDFEPVFFQALPEIRDGHSLLVHQGHLYIASTGNDSLFRYRLSGHGLDAPQVVWSVPDSMVDTHHVNSVALWGGDVVLSAFGPKTGQTWSTAVNGYIFNVTQRIMLAENIYQPHSLKQWGGDLYYCESARGRIASLGNPASDIGNYTRGLEFIAGDTLAVGSSVARKVSKSTGFINNPTDPGKPAGSCAVGIFRLASTVVSGRLTQVSLAQHGSEIYDLLFLGDILPMPGESRPASGRAPQCESQHEAELRQLQQKALEQHQALSEAQRALEIRAQELAALTQRLKVSEAELSGERARLQQESAESARLRAELQQLRSTMAQASGARPWHDRASIDWIKKLFGKTR